MTCKKSELISAINSFSAARVSEDQNLINFSAQMLSQLLETLEFASEEVIANETPQQSETIEEKVEESKLIKPRKKVEE